MEHFYFKKFLPFIFVSLSALFGSDTVQAQCTGGTPSFTVDLTGSPDSLWISPSAARGGNCCGGSSSNCIEFVITLDTGSNGIVLDIYSGARPSGALTYSIACMGTYNIGDPICLNGVGPHVIRFCKPGGNVNQYSLKALPKASISPNIIASQTCAQELYLVGLEEDSISWTSVPSNSTYESYLSCKSGCDTISVTPSGAFPSSVLYMGCGTVLGGCATNKFCDTVRVSFVNSLAVSIAPKDKYICFGDTSAFLLATPSGGLPPYNYMWSNGKTTEDVKVGAGNYTVTVTDSMNCSVAMDSTVVNAYTMAIAALPGNDTSICSNLTSFQLNGAIQSASGGRWSGPGVFTPNDSALNARYVFSPAERAQGYGDIKLATTGNNGCPPDTANIRITFDPTPAPVISGPDSTCSNKSYNYSVTALSGHTYAWTVTGGTILGSASSSSIKVLWGAPGLRSVSVLQTSDKGCDSAVSMNVRILPTPAPVITGPDSTCSNRSYTYSVANVAGHTYNWSATGGMILGSNTGNSINVLWGSSGAGSVRVVQTSAFGCDSARTRAVAIMPTPAPVITGNTISCSNRPYYYAVTPIAGNTYSWSANGGQILGPATGSSVKVLWGASGSGRITVLQTSAFGCDSSVFRNINIIPTPDPVISGPDSTCSNKSYTYSVTAISGHTYAWTATGGTILGSSSSNSIQVLWGASGAGSVRVLQTSDLGCDSALVLNITIMPTPAPVLTGTDSACSNKSYTYSIAAISGSTYNWTISGGSFLGNTNTNSVRVLWGASGTGQIRVTQTSAFGCDSSVSLTGIVIMPTPAPVISGPDSTCSNRTYNYSVSAVTGSTYVWTVTGGTIKGSSNAESISVLWGPAGTGSVRVVQTSDFGCDSAMVKTITITPTPTPIINGPLNHCSWRVANYSSGSAFGSNVWKVTGGTILGSNTASAIMVRWGVSGTGTISLTQTSPFGCDSTVMRYITVLSTPAPVITGPDSSCSERAKVYTVTSLTGHTYSWTAIGGTIVSDNKQNTVMVRWGKAGIGRVTCYQISDAGCDSSVSKNVVIIPSPTPVISGPANPCQNKVLTYSVPAMAGHTYYWMVSGGDISGSNTNNTVKVIWGKTGTGTLYLAQYSAMGCDSAVSRTVTIMPTPTPSIFGLNNTCENKPYIYSVLASPGCTYLWTINGGIIQGASNTNAVSVVWSSAGTGTIRLRQTNSSGCDSTVSKQVTIAPTPVPVVSGPGISCQNYTTKYTSNAPGFTNIWEVTGGRIISNNYTDSLKVIWDSVGTGYVKLTLISSLGCDSTISFPVFINSNPILRILGPEIVCENHTEVFTTNQAMGMTYIWNLSGGGKFTGSPNPYSTRILWTTAGQYNITLNYRNLNGCEGSDKKAILVVDFPKPIINGPKYGCANTQGNLYQGNTYTLLNKKGNSLKYFWSVSQGATFSLLNETTISVDWGAPGMYDIILRQVNTITGCEDTSMFQVEIDSIIKPRINDGNFDGCAPLTVDLFETSGGADLSYTWYLESSMVKNKPMITNTFNRIGINEVKLIATNKYGCKDSVVLQITLHPKPKADFVIQNGQPYYTDDSLVFINKSEGGMYHTWDFGDGNMAYAKDPIYRYENAGEYRVWLWTESQFGCRDSIEKRINVLLKPQIFIPNAFTPDNDDVNDHFRVQARNLTRFSIMIYNRWGQIIFRADDQDFSWDGSYQGKPVPIGVYPYLIFANGHQGEKFSLSGEIHVIK